MQIVIGTQDGDTHQLETDENTDQALQSLGIGDTFSGDVIGLPGYELEITGGSDEDGFPMSQQFNGTGRRNVTITNGVGVRTTERDGERVKRQVRGRIISEDTAQVNVKVVEQGSEPIPDLLSEGGDSGDE